MDRVVQGNIKRGRYDIHQVMKMAGAPNPGRPPPQSVNA